MARETSGHTTWCLATDSVAVDTDMSTLADRKDVVVLLLAELSSLRRRHGSSASWLFGNSLSVVNSATMPSGKLQRRPRICSAVICAERPRPQASLTLLTFGVLLRGATDDQSDAGEHVGKRVWSMACFGPLAWSSAGNLFGPRPILFLCDGFVMQWHSLDADAGAAKRAHGAPRDVS